MTLEQVRLKEIVRTATKDKDAALALLKEASEGLDLDEVRGMTLAIKGIAGTTMTFSSNARRTLMATLEGSTNGPVSDQLDRAYARVWLEFLRLYSGKEEGDVKAEGDEPDKDESSDAVGVDGGP